METFDTKTKKARDDLERKAKNAKNKDKSDRQSNSKSKTNSGGGSGSGSGSGSGGSGGGSGGGSKSKNKMGLNWAGINFGLIIAIIACILLTLFIISDESIWPAIVKLILDPLWLINFFIIITFYLLVVFLDLSFLYKTEEGREKLIKAAHKAFIAFMIAIFASIDITIVPFWFVFSFAYFTELV